ncbi:hypothetical protein DFH06DRAFT_1300662 [Mycena polygramma]|nr:hypothetical protein DFH06DRAFT_1300662 [Mycena polygramma]
MHRPHARSARTRAQSMATDTDRHPDSTSAPIAATLQRHGVGKHGARPPSSYPDPANACIRMSTTTGARAFVGPSLTNATWRRGGEGRVSTSTRTASGKGWVLRARMVGGMSIARCRTQPARRELRAAAVDAQRAGDLKRRSSSEPFAAIKRSAVGTTSRIPALNRPPDAKRERRPVPAPPPTDRGHSTPSPLRLDTQAAPVEGRPWVRGHRREGVLRVVRREGSTSPPTELDPRALEVASKGVSALDARIARCIYAQRGGQRSISMSMSANGGAGGAVGAEATRAGVGIAEADVQRYIIEPPPGRARAPQPDDGGGQGAVAARRWRGDEEHERPLLGGRGQRRSAWARCRWRGKERLPAIACCSAEERRGPQRAASAQRVAWHRSFALDGNAYAQGAAARCWIRVSRRTLYREEHMSRRG